MFTLPDNSDAATTCPPMTGPGPHPNGFFQDCGSGVGTIPTAEDFNELILNLRALLAKAGVPGVKGDATMLWRAILALVPQFQQFLFTINSAVDIYVRPGGTPNPPDPFHGQPFDSLASAFGWLGFFSITPTGSVTIHVAAATYTSSTPVLLNHPSGERVTIAGEDLASTVLYFPSSDGIYVNQALAAFVNITILGAHAGGTHGLVVSGGYVAYANLIVQNFGDVGVLVTGNGYLGFANLFVFGCWGGGVFGFLGGVLQGQSLSIIEAAAVGGALYYQAGVNLTTGGRAEIDTITVQNSNKGIDVSGAGAELRVRRIQVSGSTMPAAVEANNGGAIIAIGSVASDWQVSDPGHVAYFWANVYGLIRADHALAPGNVGACSPAVNTTGNTNSYILTS
jgi:hypothetical protein